ncbi:MAG: ribonuclease H-like domain-containing protein [Bacteroidales bacterium]|jgi:DNA polymerase-3 subunit epsilon|nr:ribonuclease H-like domain-containing protein [Bacteroidales bacterium]
MQLNLKRPLIFFDIESTGVSVGHDKIVEICLYKVFPNGEKQVRTYRINPLMHIPEQATKIHGIKDEDVKNEKSFKELSSELNEFIADSDLAGYNSNRFDIPLLVEEFLNAGVEFDIDSRHTIDVMNIFHKMEQRTLKAAYQFYCQKDLINAHSAEADTEATYEILCAQLDKYQNTSFDDNGKITYPIVNDVEALEKFTKNSSWVDMVGHIVYNEKGEESINFGKYKGKSIKELLMTDPGYISWMLKADFPLSTKRTISQIRLKEISNIGI